jgi:glycogen(starch) synthase
MLSSDPVPSPLPVLIVASWYPGVDDPARGRFVADQAEALLATGLAEPTILSFDPVMVDGGRLRRPNELETVEGNIAQAVREGDIVTSAAWGVPTPMPTVRVPTLLGLGRATPSGSDGDLRRAALLRLVERMNVEGRAGVIHAHTAYPDGYAAAGLAERLGWPLVITEHATFVARQLGRPEERRRYVEAVERSERFLAVSDVLAEELIAALPEFAHKIEVMPNTIPVEQYAVIGPEPRRGEELLFVGYRKPIKGISTLIRAFADVRGARPAATLRLVGKSPTPELEREWMQLADDLGILDGIAFDEPLDRRGVAAAMSRASLLVHPSVRETFGMTTLEALASGTPVVAARSGGISSLLEDRRLGELVPPFDSRALARAVLRALDRRDSFDPAFLRAAAAPFSASNVANRLLVLYGELLGGSGSVAAARRPVLASRASSVPERLIVVCHDTQRAALLLADMPGELLERMTVVTSGDDTEAFLPAGIGAVVPAGEHVQRELARVGLLGPRGELGDRIGRARMNPPAALARRLRSDGRARHRTAATTAGVRHALEHAVRGLREANGVPVLCVDAVDHEAAAKLVKAGRVRPLPGGILWLADAWDAQRREAARPSRSSTMSASRSPTTRHS